ncbi:MAG: DUF3141 domain-containing protein, partial [Burkholderiaceae bacterium]|nr:DUF3141 domain-containing protein [Burkholderiaceae bacterium]
QQAFNWVADVYGSTEEIKARGQVIVGLLHEDIGHLGIFVSGKVAKREHREIVSVLKSIEALPPGLYAMQIREVGNAKGEPAYEVQFEERRLEDVVKRLNRFERADEKPFEAVAALSEFNQRAYELFLQPFVQATATEAAAAASRRFHPLRMERCAISDLNPFLWWLGPAAEAVKAQRQAVSPKQSLRKTEVAAAAMASAALDLYRDLRDAATEASFFQTYGTLFGLYLADSAAEHAAPNGDGGRAYVQQALAAIEHGGFTAAVARTASLLAQRGVAIDLDKIALKKELVADYRELLPQIDFETARQVRGTQDLIVAHAPDLAIETLPRLLSVPADRDRFARFFERVLSDSRVSSEMFTAEQRAMFERIWSRLDLPLPGRARLARGGRSARTAAPARKAAARKSTVKAKARSSARV